MFRGFATVNFYADDPAAARDWYAELFGVEAYYASPPAPAAPAYVEFRIGDSQDELGLLDRRYAPEGYSTAAHAGAIMHWHVDDIQKAYDHLLAHGATGLSAPRPLGEPGWEIATVADPFGNLIGLMHSPHYLDMLAR